MQAADEIHTISWADSVSVGYIKRTLRAPAKENTLVLIAVGIGDKNTVE